MAPRESAQQKSRQLEPRATMPSLLELCPWVIRWSGATCVFLCFLVAALSLRSSIGKKEPEAGRRRSSLQAWRGF